MRTGKIVCCIFFFFFFFAVSTYGADVAKIGVVDFQRILKTSSAGKEARTEIQKKGEELAGDLQNREKELKGMGMGLERDLMLQQESEMLDAKKIEEKKRAYRIRINDFQTLKKQYDNEMMRLERTLVGGLRDDILELAEAMGKKEGYLLIIEKSVVVYSPNTIEITDKLIQQMNAKFAHNTGNKAEQKK
jgi:outer membrane protein